MLTMPPLASAPLAAACANSSSAPAAVYSSKIWEIGQL
jgi:hypothetical protein